MYSVAAPTAALRGGNRQAFTSLRPAALQHLASILGGHAHEKSVRALAAPAIWLKRYTHGHEPLQRKERERRNLNSNQTLQTVSIGERRLSVSETVCYSRFPHGTRP